MTSERDIERVLDHWFSERPTQVADRVLDEVADRIARQPQQLAWRVPRRDSHVNTNLKALVAIAAIIVVAVAGFAVLRPPSPAGIGGPGATESPALTPHPSISPSAAIECEDDLPGCEGPLLAGTHNSNQFEPVFSYETTSPTLGEWLNVVDIPAIYKIDQRNPSDPYVLLWSDAAIVDQNDQCGTNPDPSLGRRAADWIEFVTNHPEIDASEPVNVDLGGVTGQQVELAVSDGSTATCSEFGGFYIGLLTQPVEGRPSKYGLPTNQRLLMTVVDVGDRTVVMQTYGPGDAAAFAASTGVIRDLIATFKFGCGPSAGRPCDP
jgi:hypothetical protein